MNDRTASLRSASDSSRQRGSSSNGGFDLNKIKNMIYGLRVTELQTFLREIGQSKAGNKAELQVRALDNSRNLTQEQYKYLEGLYDQRHGGLQPPPPTRQSLPSINAPPTAHGRHSSSTAPSSRDYISMPIWSQPSNLMGDPHKTGSAIPRYNPNWTSAPGFNPVPSQQVAPPLSETSSYAFSKLPFFEEVQVIIPPTNLNPTPRISGQRHCQELHKNFTLTVNQANMISQFRKILPNIDFEQGLSGPRVDFKNQLLLRIAMTQGDARTVEDLPPATFQVTINGKMAQLPPPLPITKGQPKGQSFERPWLKPLDITPLAKLSPTTQNSISITWSHPSLPHSNANLDYSKIWCFTLILCTRLGADELISKVKSKGIKPAEFTKSIIKDKLRDQDDEIATTSLRASLFCPIGKTRLQLPGRSIICNHIQCFELGFFIQMNEKKPTWICPVCDKKISFDSLVVDGLFSEILATPKSECSTEVQFNDVNNSVEWQPIMKEERSEKAETVRGGPSKPSAAGSSSIPQKRRHDIDDTGTGCSPSKNKKDPKEPEIIDLSDSDEDEDEDEDEDDDSNLAGMFNTTNQPPFSQSRTRDPNFIVNLSDDDGSLGDLFGPSSHSPTSFLAGPSTSSATAGPSNSPSLPIQDFSYSNSVYNQSGVSTALSNPSSSSANPNTSSASSNRIDNVTPYNPFLADSARFLSFDEDDDDIAIID